MKNRVLSFKAFSLFALSIFLFSCSDMKEFKKMEEDETLRAISLQLTEQTSWTDEIESGRLTENIKSTDGIVKSIALSPLAVVSGGNEASVEAIYPYLEGFGSLDTSNLPQTIHNCVTEFCTALQNDKDADSWMSKKGLYSLGIFYQDLAKHHSPAENIETQPADPKEPESDSSPEEEIPLVFDEWIMGEPFITPTSFEVPVRCIGTDFSVDIYLFLIKEDTSWKIDQLQVQKWGEGNGTK